MDRLKFLLIAALDAALACTHPAFAQTASTVSIVSGNGQAACLTCFFAKDQRFQPMVVRVMDAKGKPIADTAVGWTVAALTGQPGVLVSGPTTQTDKNGLTSNTYFQYGQAGSPLRPFLQSTIVATAGDASATFTATEGLTFPGNALIRYINAVLVSPPEGASLTGSAGAPGALNIQVHVDAFGVPVPNMSVRLVKSQNATVSIACATGPGADPGSVLTDANGDAVCMPIFGPAGGAASFTVLAGGVDYNRTTSGYWQSSPPIAFSVAAHGPGKLLVSAGNAQSVYPGQTLPQSLTAKVTESGSAKPVSAAPVTWTVSPAGSATVINTRSTSDAGGLVSTDVVVANTAVGSLTVTVAIADNPNISATFTIAVKASPAGPGLTADSFYNAAGLARGWISPCSLASIIAPGLAPGITGVVAATTQSGPLPYTLAGDQVSFNGIPAPIFNVSNSNGQEQVTVQVPCEVSPGAGVPVTVNAAGASATVNTTVLPVAPGIFESVMSDGLKRALAARADGSFVTLENPAQRGEVIRIYLTGMGPVAPAVSTNAAPLSGTDSLVLGQVSVQINDAVISVPQSRLAPGPIGVYELAFPLDANSATGNKVTLSVSLTPAAGGQAQVSNVSYLPIQ